jgi:hypothetical protein
MALRPGTLRPCLVLAIVGVARALGPLPAAPAFTLTGNLTAVTLPWNLRPRPECLVAARTSRALHRCISAQVTCAETIRCRRPTTTTSAGWHLQARPVTAPRASAADEGTGRGLIASARWVNSYEHTRVNSGERQGRTNTRKCGIQPAYQSLITDVFRSRPLLCTIHHLINFTPARGERPSRACGA